MGFVLTSNRFLPALKNFQGTLVTHNTHILNTRTRALFSVRKRDFVFEWSMMSKIEWAATHLVDVVY